MNRYFIQQFSFVIVVTTAVSLWIFFSTVSIINSVSSDLIAEPVYWRNDTVGTTVRSERSLLTERYAIEWKTPDKPLSGAQMLADVSFERSPSWITEGRVRNISELGVVTPNVQTGNGIPDYLLAFAVPNTPSGTWIFNTGFPFRQMALQLPIIQISPGEGEFFVKSYSNCGIVNFSIVIVAANLLVFYFVSYVFYSLVSMIIIDVRIQKNLCVRCSYSLVGINCENCPECGSAVLWEIVPLIVKTPDNG